jgi:hypothetical protein
MWLWAFCALASNRGNAEKSLFRHSPVSKARFNPDIAHKIFLEPALIAKPKTRNGTFLVLVLLILDTTTLVQRDPSRHEPYS